MATGILIGAWLLSRKGWSSVVATSVVTATLALIDTVFGSAIGHRLAEVTISLFR